MRGKIVKVHSVMQIKTRLPVLYLTYDTLKRVKQFCDERIIQLGHNVPFGYDSVRLVFAEQVRFIEDFYCEIITGRLFLGKINAAFRWGEVNK